MPTPGGPCGGGAGGAGGRCCCSSPRRLDTGLEPLLRLRKGGGAWGEEGKKR